MATRRAKDAPLLRPRVTRIVAPAAAPALAELNPMRAIDESMPPFTDDDWLYEVKWDGWRVLAEVEAGQVRLRTKNGADCTTWFPEVAEGLSELFPAGRRMVVDAEVCVLDAQGRSDFDRLQDRAKRRRRYEGCDPVTLMVFDLLVLDGLSTMALPLVERKSLLAEQMALLPKKSVLFVGDFPAEAALFKKFVVGMQLEGFMAKRKDAPYTQGPDRSRDWLKVKRKGAVPAERFKRA